VSRLRAAVARTPAPVALVACALGGALCYALHTPLPWMIGPLVTMAVLRFCGFAVRAPRGARELGQIVISAALGLYFTPAVANEVLAHWELLFAAAAFATLLAYIGAWILYRWTDTDRTTALFASVPGGAAEMANLGDRFGARPERIAVAQSLRIMLVVVIVPFAMTWWGVHGTETYTPAGGRLDAVGLAALLACAAAGGIALWFVGSPNPFMLGPLSVAIGLTVAQIEWSSVPPLALNGAQVLLACNLGSRFESDFMRRAPRFVLVVVLGTIATMVISAAFGLALAFWSGLPPATLVLATAPGGIAEMCVTASVLQLGVPLVTAAHVARVIILVTTTAPVFRLMRGVLRRTGRF
jgi:membrane AbrB-like protein